MAIVVIDAEGTVSQRASPHADPAGIAIRNKEWVVIRRRGGAAPEVWYCPKFAADLALLRAVERLDRDRADRMVLHACLSEGLPPFVSEFNDGLAHLMRLAMAEQGRRRGDFMAARHALDRVARDADFGRLYEAYRKAGALRTRDLMETVREASRARYLEVDPRDGAARLVLSAVGPSYSIYGRGWKSNAVGNRFEDMPDYEYATWAATTYRDAFRLRMPIFEDVSAIVRMPFAQPLQLTYRRAVLPLGGGNEPSVLLGATLGQSVSRLALGAGQEGRDIVQ